MITDVHIAGGAMTPFNRRKDQSSFRDWARAAAHAALKDSGLELCDVGSLIVASESDFFTLQLNPAALLADELGMVGVSAKRVEGGGASGHVAVQAGVAEVASGLAKRVMVLGVEPSASHLGAADVSDLYSLSFDAWTDGMTGIDATALYALSALDFMAHTGATHQDFARIAVRNRQNARQNPNAHLPLDVSIEDVAASPMISSPYHRLDCSPLSDGAAAIILARDDTLPNLPRSRARFRATASATDSVRLGERFMTGFFTGKQSAGVLAYQMANTDPSQIDLAEVYDSYSGAQLQAVEALRFADDFLRADREGHFDASGRLPINLSGGLLGQGAPVGAVGVAQILTAAQQLEGRYVGLQPKNPPHLALVDTHGGIATLNCVSILEAS